MNIRNCCYVMLFLAATLFSSSVYAYSYECRDAFLNGTQKEFSDCEDRARARKESEETIERANKCRQEIEWCRDHPDSWNCPPSC